MRFGGLRLENSSDKIENLNLQTNWIRISKLLAWLSKTKKCSRHPETVSFFRRSSCPQSGTERGACESSRNPFWSPRIIHWLREPCFSKNTCTSLSKEPGLVSAGQYGQIWKLDLLNWLSVFLHRKCSQEVTDRSVFRTFSFRRFDSLFHWET